MTDPGRLTRGTPPPPAGVRGAPAEDGASAAAAAAAAEDGPLLAEQHGGADPAHVHVRPGGPLDGLHLVRPPKPVLRGMEAPVDQTGVCL